MSKASIKRVKQAIEDIKNGKMIIMIDDEDRENEGDIVYGATFSTPQKVNFCATHAKGLICVSLSVEIATRLELNPMVVNNDSSYETAFTVSVDAKDAKTGISAYERDDTIKLLASSTSISSDFVKPGHIFPLIAKKGGTLVRVGHTEGSVDICHLSGISKSAVICEIMNEDGSMARRDDLDKFAKEHNLNSVYISDIVEYRLQHESIVSQIKKEDASLIGNEVQKVVFSDNLGIEHSAYVFGELGDVVNVRFKHLSNDIELFENKEYFDIIVASIDYLAKNGGILIYINSMDNLKVNRKEYGIGAGILKYLGVKEINLVSTKDSHNFIGISGFGLKIRSSVSPI